jgi:protein SCO1/2
MVDTLRPTRRRLRTAAVPPLLAVLLCGIVVSVWACTPAGPAAPPPTPELNGAALDPVVNLPPLMFMRSDGGMFNSADTFGRTSLFFFGYTHCADVCPLTLSELAQMHRALGSAASQVDMYFVTLDPARSTPEQMQSYMANFPGVIGLTGSDAELAAAQASFHVVAQRHDLGGGQYLLDHTAAIYLVNRTGQIQLAYPYGTPPNDIMADVQLLGSSRAPNG